MEKELYRLGPGQKYPDIALGYIEIFPGWDNWVEVCKTSAVG